MFCRGISSRTQSVQVPPVLGLWALGFLLALLCPIGASALKSDLAWVWWTLSAWGGAILPCTWLLDRQGRPRRRGSVFSVILPESKIAPRGIPQERPEVPTCLC